MPNFNSAGNIWLDRLAVINRPDPSPPQTYDEALRKARDLAQDLGTLIHYTHQGLEMPATDEVSPSYGRSEPTAAT